MKNINIGNLKINDIYLGNKNILKAYIGETLLFSKEDSSTTNTIPIVEWKFEENNVRFFSIDMDKDYNIYSSTSIGNRQGAIFKINKEGQGSKIYENKNTELDTISVDDNNKWIYCSGRDNIIRKISFTGEEIWQTPCLQDINAIHVDSDSNFYYQKEDIKLLKISPNGDNIWKNNSRERIWNISTNNKNDIAVTSGVPKKISSDTGETIWAYYSKSYYSCRDVAITQEGEVYAGYEDEALVKLTKDGEVIWDKSMLPLPDSSYWGVAIEINIDNSNNLYACGYYPYLKKFSPQGDMIWEFLPDNEDYYTDNSIIDDKNNIYLNSFENFILKIKQVAN